MKGVDMMETKWIFMLATLWLVACSGSQQKTGWDEYGLKGKLKSVAERRYAAGEKFGKLQKGGKGSRVAHLLFDEKGNLLERRNDGGQTKWTYDTGGNKIEEACYGSGGDLNYKITFAPDGNVIKYVWNEQVANYKYDYDKKGNWVKRYETDREGNAYITEREIVYYP